MKNGALGDHVGANVPPLSLAAAQYVDPSAGCDLGAARMAACRDCRAPFMLQSADHEFK